MDRHPASPARSPAERFRREIADALAGGATADGLTLQLTLMDASKVKRDADLPLDHVSFSPDGMRFMGVRVVEGGVRTSALVAGPVEPAAPAEPAPKAPRARARKAKAVA